MENSYNNPGIKKNSLFSIIYQRKLYPSLQAKELAQMSESLIYTVMIYLFKIRYRRQLYHLCRQRHSISYHR